ncbi:MAG TPA: ABC transporter substrate-binding protein [Candidatus Methanomethylia archaeon]|nr:ABC transporter substrate-binding protein [Candidatus Methanomethylicia archaeon]
MKRSLVAIVVTVVVIAAVVIGYLSYSTPPPEGKEAVSAKKPRFVLEIYGNANMDELIDEKDIEYLQKIIEGKAEATKFADANGDGTIDEKDVEHVQAIISGNAPFILMLDGNGDFLNVTLPINRVGVEYLSNVELMRILEVEDRVVAVDFAPYQLRSFYFPEKADELANLGNMYKPDYEHVLSLNLDALFTFSPYDIAEKRKNLPGVNVIFLGLYWPDVINVNASRFIQGVMKAGYIFNKVERAKAYVDWLLSIIDDISSRTKTLSDDEKPNVLMTALIGYFRDPSTTQVRTYTVKDPLSQMCILAGGKPIAQELPEWLGPRYYATVDIEWVLEKDPEYIFIHTVRYTYSGVVLDPAYGYEVDNASSMKAFWDDITSRPLLADVNAIKNKKVYIIAGDFRNNAMGSVLGAVYLAKILHPDLFKDLNPEDIHQEYITHWLRLNYDLNKHGVFLYPPLIVDGEVIGAPQQAG